MQEVLRSRVVRFLAVGSVLGFALVQPYIASARSEETPEQSRRIRGTLVSVSDGDTIRFLPLNSQGPALRVRMVVIDTAETHFASPSGPVDQGYWGQMGTETLKSMIAVGDSLELESQGLDRYGRTLGRLFKDGLDVNLEMVRSGWAALYSICGTGRTDCLKAGLPDGEFEKYRAACREAVQAGRGLFDPQNPVPQLPFHFRALHSPTGLHRPVADLEKKILVSPTDFEQVDVCDRIFYADPQDAIRDGFSDARQQEPGRQGLPFPK